MSTSQGIRMMHKNFMSLEKENMQIDIASAMTNQVKKYTQEVETSMIFFNMLYMFLQIYRSFNLLD